VQILYYENLSGAFSAHISYSLLLKQKKEGKVALICSLYGCFLSVRIASTTPIMTMTIITAAIPSSTVPVDAKPVTGDG
jgi:hypothetical protein